MDHVTVEPARVFELPTAVKITGKLYEAYQWTDKTGENLLVTSLTDIHSDPQPKDGEETQSAALYIYHYIKNNNDSIYTLKWKKEEEEKECPFDITCEFLKSSIQVTDLDHNGIGEFTLLYKMACRSDVSPAYMKLVLREDQSEYSLGGAMWIRSMPGDSFRVTEQNVNLETLPKKNDEMDQVYQGFGRYETEKSFANAPPAFLVYARQQWLKFVKELTEY